MNCAVCGAPLREGRSIDCYEGGDHQEVYCQNEDCGADGCLSTMPSGKRKRRGAALNGRGPRLIGGQRA